MVARLDTEQILELITQLLPLLLRVTSMHEACMRGNQDSLKQSFIATIDSFIEDIRKLSGQLDGQDLPEHVVQSMASLADASAQVVTGLQRYQAANGSKLEFVKLIQANRSFCRAQEILYPLATVFAPLSQFFLTKKQRENAQLLAALKIPAQNKVPVGLLNGDNGREKRGGFSLYVPESFQPEKSMPLIIALHGGSGHGADFIWSWLRDARSHDCIVMAPTSQQDTWSLMGPDLDLSILKAMLEYLQQTWNINSDKILLTGMSDGATYSLLAGLQEGSPFTHIAALSGVLHPINMANGNLQRAKNKPVYLVHGAKDWMFPLETAHMAKSQLETAGAKLVYKEIEDLGHTYAREENEAILQWFLE